MMLTIVDNFPGPKDPSFEWKVRSFFAWFNKYYKPVVDHHHEIEETIIFPWLAEKVTVPEKVNGSHDDLESRMNAIARYESYMDSGASQAQVGTFRKMVREYVVVMNDHIAEEEAIIPALIRQSIYTEADWLKLVDEIVGGLGLSGNMTFLPGILWAANAWAGNQIDELVPLPSAIERINKTYWEAAFQKESLDVLYALAKGDEEPPVGPCLNMCVCPCQPEMNGTDLECCCQACACPVVTCSIFAMICSGLPCCTMLGL